MRLLVLLVVAVGLTGCSSAHHAPAATDSADVTFFEQMLPHHRQAVAAAQLAVTAASDPRVRAFAQRIVREQTPEIATMASESAARSLTLDTTAGAMAAMHRISDDQLAALQALHGKAFDVQFLTLSIASEQGAAVMARTEVGAGRDAAALTLADAIASSPTNEIPQLMQLLASVRA